MSNYINEFDFNEKKGNGFNIIKIVLIMIIVFVMGTIIIRSCSRIFDDNEMLDENGIKEERKYDINKPFKELGIHSQEGLDDYLYEVSKYLKPKEFQNLIDWSETKYYKFKGQNWDAYNNGWEILEQKFEWPTHDELIRRVVYKGNDWSILPLSERFREKFKGISIPEYYGYPDDRVYRGDDDFKWIKLDIYTNGTTFSFEELTGNGEETNKVYFKYYYDENGYLDDVELTNVVPVYDRRGHYIPKENKYLMDREDSIKRVLSYILPNKDFGDMEGNAGWNPLSSPFFYDNVVKEIGMTDRFREYFESINDEGFLQDKLVISTSDSRKSDRFEIENIDIKKKHATAKTTIMEKKTIKMIKYYDVYWTTDEEYKLDSIDVKLNREEKLADKD